MCFVRSDPSLYLSTQDESIPEFDETNSALDESKRSDAWWVGLASRRDELGGHKSDHDETIWGVDETNSSATRGIGRIHDEMIWGVDETNSVHNETNQNNDSTTRNANLVSDLTSYETNKRSCEGKYFVTSSWEMKLTGKKSFCKEADNFFPLKRNNYLPLNYLKEISLSIWSSSHRDINSPSCCECSVICICGDGRNIHHFYCFLYQTFPQTTAEKRII